MNPKNWHEIWQKMDSEIDEEFDKYLKNSENLDSLNQHEQSIFEALPQSRDACLEDLFFDQPSRSQSIEKYEIIKELSRGGQSHVYLGKRKDGFYSQTVVIKVMNNRYHDEMVKQHFLKEMQLLANITHPGVVKIIDGKMTSDSKPCLILEYIKGEHLDKHCLELDLSTQEKTQLIAQICEALKFIHQRSILHKDIKPDNVLVRSINGVPYPVLIDFGISEYKNKPSELIFATKTYSAPEMIAGKNIDHRADIYSLGIMFGQILLQKPKQTASEPVELEQAESKSQLLQQLKDQGINPELLQIITACTHENPKKRYPSVALFQSDLNNWLSGYPISLNSQSVSYNFKKWISRNKMLAGLSLSTLLLAILFSMKYTFDINRLQSITEKEKDASSDLINFMLEDLYEDLSSIGRVDLLKSVADKSLQRLKEQSAALNNNKAILQSAKAYINTAKVYDQLHLSDEAQGFFQQSLSQLDKIDNQNQKKIILEAISKVNLAKVLSTEKDKKQHLQEALELLQSSKQNGSEAQDTLWDIYIELAYWGMEYGSPEESLKALNLAQDLTEQRLKKSPQKAHLYFQKSQTLQALAWYQLDFVTMESALNTIRQAIKSSAQSIELESTKILYLHNQRVLNNQLVYLLIENQQLQQALQAALLSIQQGQVLDNKAPSNQEYKRELSYSYTNTGDIYLSLKQNQKALEFYSKSLNLSKQLHERDTNDYSLANDYVIDLLKFLKIKSEIHQQINQGAAKDVQQEQMLLAESNKILNQSLNLMQPIQQSEPNNKYYSHTLLTIYLHLKEYKKARPLYDLVKNHGLIDDSLSQLIKESGLDWLNLNNE